ATDSCPPCLHCLGAELSSVVAAVIYEESTQHQELHSFPTRRSSDLLAGDTDRQAFMGKLVEHVEHPILASVMGAVLDEVIGPDMIALLRAQPHARSIGQPEPAALGLLRWDLQPLASPDTLDPLVVDYPARLPQQSGDLAIAVAAVLPGQLDNIGRETLLVVTTKRHLAFSRAMP